MNVRTSCLRAVTPGYLSAAMDVDSGTGRCVMLSDKKLSLQNEEDEYEPGAEQVDVETLDLQLHDEVKDSQDQNERNKLQPWASAFGRRTHGEQGSGERGHRQHHF